MLSAKLYEDKIVMIESEKLETGKTAYLDEILSPLKTEKILFLTSFNNDENFTTASKNLQNVDVKTP
jgi:ribosomal protein L4